MRRWVVVGGGAAGCVVAARLSERPDAEVIVLEAGPDHGADAPADDVGPHLSDPQRTRVEHVVRRPGRAPEPYWQGSGLGGSSLVNGTVITAGPPGSVPGVPTEEPWADGAVGAALLASDDRARRVALVRHDRARLTAADVHLRPVLDRPNLDVRCSAPVRAVRLERRRAVGVALADGSTVDADRVVVCAGAIRTPALLLRSGVDAPGIGEHLQDHPAFTIALGLRDGAIDPSAPTISVAATHEHHQIIALNHLPGSPGLGALTVGLLDVASEGSVRLGDDGEPRVELRLLTDSVDRDRMSAGVVGAIDLLEDDAWAPVIDGAFVDAVGTSVAELATSPDGVDAWVVDHIGSHHHVSGSCRDGVATEGGVVRGYSGLYVADASALPGVPRLDPYLAVIRQADRLVTSW